MDSEINKSVEEKLDQIVILLRHLLALQLAKEGIPHQKIAKHIHVAKATLGSMLKGVSKDG